LPDVFFLGLQIAPMNSSLAALAKKIDQLRTARRKDGVRAGKVCQLIKEGDCSQTNHPGLFYGQDTAIRGKGHAIRIRRRRFTFCQEFLASRIPQSEYTRSHGGKQL